MVTFFLPAPFGELFDNVAADFELDIVEAAHLSPNAFPGFAGLVFSDGHQNRGDEAEKDAAPFRFRNRLRGH